MMVLLFKKEITLTPNWGIVLQFVNN